MSDQMVYYIELKGKVDDLQGQLERLFKDITERSKKAKDDIDNGLQPPPIEKYNKYIEAKKKLDGKSKT